MTNPPDWQAGNIYKIRVEYSNLKWNGDTDFDGCTMYAYRGGGVVYDSPVFADLNTDCNNDNVIDVSQDGSDQLMEESPGRYIECNGNPVRVNLDYGPKSDTYNWTVQLVATGYGLRVWSDSTKQTEIVLPRTYRIGTDSIPSELWVEGVEPGQAMLDAILANNQGTELNRDRIVFTFRPHGDIAINNGNEYTSSQAATLTLSDGGSGMTEMRLKDESSEWGAWVTYTTSSSWTLSAGHGLKTVFVQYRDSAMRESDVYSDTITFGPVGGVPSNVYCVKTSANGGSDENHDGTSWAEAFATVQHAISMATGSTRNEIWVAAGDYPLPAGQSYVLEGVVGLYGGFPAAGGEDRDWLANETSLIGDSSDFVVLVGYDATTNAVIDGFTIRGALWHGIGSWHSSATISHNKITGNRDSGVSFNEGTPMMYDNVITLNGRNGVDVLSNSVDKPLIVNNTITHNTEAGILCHDDALIANNIVLSNGYGISAATADDVRNNCSYGNYSYDYSPASVPSSNISADPLLSEDGLHLTECSICVDKGLNSATTFGQFDIDRNARRIGPTVDIGADEFVYSGRRLTMPTYDHAAGAYPSEIDVRITADSDAVITYSTDEESVPLQPGTEGAQQVPASGIVHLSGWTVLKATAWVTGCDPSCTSEAIYNAGGPPRPYYVMKPEHGGSDSNSGTSWGQAFATVQKAINMAQSPLSARKVVWVAAGDYTLNVGESNVIYDVIGLYGGFPAAGGDDRNSAQNVTSLIGDYTTYADVVAIATGSMLDTVVDGFTIRGGFDGIGCYGSDATISHNKIIDNACGIYSDVWTNPVVTNNVISSTYYCGVYLDCSNGIDQPVFTNNIISGSDGGGIDVWGHVVLANNITVKNSYGISTQYPDEVQNNCSYDNYYCDYWPFQAPSSNISIDPLFDTDGYHLTGCSPCIDQGLDSVVSTGQIDIDGDARKIGAAVDIGVDEYVYSGCRGPMLSFAPDGGIYTSDVDVTITSANPEAAITYTVDGSEPLPPTDPGVPSSVVVHISGHKVLKAKSWLGSCQPGCKMSTYYAGGSPYFVKTAENDGDDNHGGTSWSDAFATVQHAIDVASQPGSQSKDIWVAAGDYSPTTYPYFWMYSTVHLYGGFPAAGSGNSLDDRDWLAYETKLTGGNDNPTLLISGGSRVKPIIDGFTIRNGYDGADLLDWAGATFSHNKFIDNYVCGVYADQWTKPVLSHNVMNSGYYGLYADAYASPVVSNNVISSIYYCGLYLYCANGIDQPAFTNNTISGGVGGGIDVWGDVVVANNITVYNDYGIAADTADNIQNNCSYGNFQVDYWPTSVSSSNLKMDPLFDTDGWHLTGDSPCIDQGLNSMVHTGDIDIDGDARTIGPNVDIGADEYMYTGCRARMPSFDPDEGMYPSSLFVTITGDLGDTITYSLDGSDPLPPSDPSALIVPQDGRVEISSSLTLSAKSWSDTCSASSIRRAFYWIAPMSLSVSINLTASPTAIGACTGEGSEIQATVTDTETGQPYSDLPITLRTSIGQFGNESKQETVITDNDGVATVTLYQGTASAGSTASITVSLLDSPPSARLQVPIILPSPLIYHVLACDDHTIAVYWSAMKGATGYEVYRSTASGMYQDPPLSTPVNISPVDDGVCYYIDDNVLSSQEYFYTVKAVYECGVSDISNEESDIPVSAAIPWNTRNAALITSAFLAITNYSDVDNIRVLGPDGEVYDNIYGTLPPDGQFLDNNTFVLTSTGEAFALTTDGEEPSTEGAVNIQQLISKTQVNPTDGPIRRVRSQDGFRGVSGYIIVPDQSSVYRATDWLGHNVADDFYNYLGHRREFSRIEKGRSRIYVSEVDAGIQYTIRVTGGGWLPYLLTESKLADGSDKYWRRRGNDRWVLMDPRYEVKYLGSQHIYCAWTLWPIGNSRNYTGSLILSGVDPNLESKTVLWGLPSRFGIGTAMMKRCHSIANGDQEGNGVAGTGSFMRNVGWRNGQLIRPYRTWEEWTDGPDVTESQGSYPLGGGFVFWNEDPPYSFPFSKETGINIYARQDYP